MMIDSIHSFIIASNSWARNETDVESAGLTTLHTALVGSLPFRPIVTIALDLAMAVDTMMIMIEDDYDVKKKMWYTTSNE